VSLHRGIDGSEPLRPERIVDLAGASEHRFAATRVLATGTLACPGCDAPVAPLDRPMGPADPLACPFCAHAGAVRDFLSLESPSRPARVIVRVSPQRRLAARSRALRERPE
jgi:hypothetical protein